MINIRVGTFETNSSSVHSFVYIPYEIFERWKEEEILIHFPEHDYNIAYDITPDDIVEISYVDGSGMRPRDPFTYEGYFPYRMFVDSDLEEEWIDSGTLLFCDIDEKYYGGAVVSVTYMG